MHIFLLLHQMNHLILAADSRGVVLENYAATHSISKEYEIHQIIMPGGKISTISAAINKTIRKIKSINVHIEQNIQIVMMAGICSLTEKFKHINGTEVKYIRDTNNIELIKQDISNLYHNMQKNQIHFKVAHFVPANLTKYTTFNQEKRKLTTPFYTAEKTITQQQHLEEDITNINNHISHLNQQFHRYSVRWDRDLISCKSKKRGRNGQIKKKIQTVSYKNLYDGVHANQILKDKWFYYLFQSIEKDNTENKIDDSDSDCENTWDFKRSKLD